jgi:imidazolonepropionase-like amidohydrolase
MGARRPFVVGLAAAVLAAGVFSLSTAQSAPASIVSPEGKALVIRGVRLFDGDRVVFPADVIVRGGRIVSAGPTGAAIPPDAEIVDGTGKTLLPGLIDSHVHVMAADNLKQCLAFGVTAVIDMFMSPQAMKAIKAAQSSAEPPLQAFLVSPGILCTVPGGHGTQFGLTIPTIEAGTDSQAFVDARIAEGADFIKLIQDDFSSYGMKRPTLTKDQVAGLIQAAHRRGMIAVIHAATLRNCLDSLEAGVDGLAHLYFENKNDPDFGNTAARHKAFVIPTLSVISAMNGPGPAPGLLDDAALKPFLKPDDVSGFKARSTALTAPGAYEAAQAALRQLRAAGVPLLAGTDTPNPGTAFGAAMHSELELLVMAGLTPIEALRAATSIPAEKFSLPERGRIRPGAAADLVLVEGDPTVSIKDTRKIVGVWKGGRPVDREAYRAGVADAVRAAQNAPVAGYGPSGLIADFEDGKISTAFGSGWMVSTDAFGGGKSTAAMEWAPGGEEETRGAMKISGEIKGGAAFAWAGAAFSPGTSIMAPANLGSKKGVTFWAKGSARSCAIEFFSRSRGFRPVAKNFTVGSEWKEYAVTFEELGLDGTDIMMIFFGAVNDPGPFSLWIDGIRLK